MDGTFGWKVHRMVHGKNVYGFLLYSSEASGRLKGRPSWSQAVECGPWSILQLKKLHILCWHLTWIAAVLLVTTWQTGLSQVGAKTDMTLFLASIMHFCTKLYITAVNKLSVSRWHRQATPGQTLYPSIVCCGTHRSLQNKTIYSFPLLWYSHISLSNTIPCLFRIRPKGFPKQTAFPFLAALTSKVVWQVRLSNQCQHRLDQATVRCMLHESLACV